MIRELGYCSGIENYSRYLDGRAPGTRPFCLLDYFPEDYLMIINKSGVAIRLAVEDLRVMGRATQGVRLINLKGNDSIAAVAKVMREDEEDIEAIEGLDEEGVEEGTADTKPADTNGTTIDTQEEE